MFGRPHASATSRPSRSAKLKGGNSNWRGPIWFPTTFLIIESLRKLGTAFGDDAHGRTPARRSAGHCTRWRATSRAGMIDIFLLDENGRRPVFGGARKFQDDPHWRDHLLFYEYFHGDNGAGLGAPPDRLDGARREPDRRVEVSLRPMWRRAISRFRLRVLDLVLLRDPDADLRLRCSVQDGRPVLATHRSVCRPHHRRRESAHQITGSGDRTIDYLIVLAIVWALDLHHRRLDRPRSRGSTRRARARLRSHRAALLSRAA